MDRLVAVEGLAELRAGLRRVDKDLDRQLGREMQAAIEETVMGQIRAGTPRGPTGRLAGATRIQPAGNQVRISNAMPYSNSIHWGREFWPNVESDRAARSYVKGRPFIWGPLEEHKELLAEKLGQILDAALGHVLPH